jgi:hypothetical protein
VWYPRSLQRYYGTDASNLATSPPEPHQVRARRLRFGEEAMPEQRRQRLGLRLGLGLG